MSLFSPSLDFTDLLCDSLVEKGWFASKEIIPMPLCQQLFLDLKIKEKQGLFRQAHIGRGNRRQKKTQIRNDQIHWLQENDLTESEKSYFSFIEQLSKPISRDLFLSLQSFEAHYSIYKKGQFYKKHIDQHLETKHRQLSCILYLNPLYKDKDGGELIIYDQSNPKKIDQIIYPEWGLFVCFLSGKIIHEVRPAQKKRYALSGWMRDRIEFL